MLYNYRFENGHCVIKIDGYDWLLDTGSPNTFCIEGGLKNIVIDGTSYRLSVNPGYNLEAVEKAVGIKLNGIIGADLLSKTSFTLYRGDEGDATMEFKSISLDNVSEDVKPIDFHGNQNVIIGNVKIDDKNLNVLFDVGAHISYLKPGIFKVDSNELNEDYDKDFKKILSRYYIAFWDYGMIKLEFGEPVDKSSYPVQAMNYCNVDAIIGLYNFKMNMPIFFKYYSMDFKNKKLYIE